MDPNCTLCRVLTRLLTELCAAPKSPNTGGPERKIQLTIVANDTQAIKVLPHEVDAAGYKTPLGTLTATPDDPAKVAVASQPDGSWLISLAPGAQLPATGAVTFADAAGNLSAQVPYQFDPSAPTSLTFETSLVSAPPAAPVVDTTGGATPQAPSG